MRFNRLNIKHFAELATNNGIFGSAQLSDNNSGVITSDMDQIASLQAFKEGWESATLSSKRLPTIEEMQGLQCYFSYAINYLYQNGIALWNTNQVYFKGSQCRTYVNYKVQIWNSLVDNNTGNNPVLTTGFWEEHKSGFAEVADKLGTSNVGSSIKPLYLSSGTPVASDATVGTTTKPVYLSGGEFKQGDELAKTDLSNIDAGGEQVIIDLVGPNYAKIDLSNLSATGKAYIAIKGYNSSTTYSLDEVVMSINSDGEVKLYKSLANNNTSALSDDTKWEEMSLGGNTPFFFGWSQYFKNAPYNASWLASNGQYNASSLYPDFWTQLTGVELNSSLNVGDTIEISGKTYVKRGLPVVLSTGTITDYDFVVNQNDQTFRLPLLNGEEDLAGNTFENITYNGHGSNYTATKNGTFCILGYGSTADLWLSNQTAGTAVSSEGNTDAQSIAQCVIDVKKGDTVQAGYYNGTVTKFGMSPAIGNGTLYYYVGDTVQDATVIDASAVLSVLSNKVGYDDLTPVHAVVQTYRNGASWYRVYDDGWVEQGGQVYTADQTVSFLKSFANTNYSLTIGYNDTHSPNDAVYAVVQWREKTNSGVRFQAAYQGNYFPCTIDWRACGQGASS